VSAIDSLLAIKHVSPAILDVLVSAIADGDVSGEQVARDPGWALGSALRATNHNVFAAYLQRISPREADDLRAQRPAIGLDSHKDLADRALRKLVEPHLPATLKALQRAIAREAAEHDRKRTALRHTAGDATAGDSNEDPAAASNDDGDGDGEL
jgi:hypothetical protein